MHRELAHISSKLSSPIELQGRTVRKSAASPAETFGSWEKLLSRTNAYHRVVSPNQVAERTIEAKNAGRTLHPEMSDEQQRKTRKIKSTRDGPEDPGNMLILLKKSGTVETALNTRKKAFKGCLQTEQTTTPQFDKRLLNRPHPKKQEEWFSHLQTLTSPTCMGETEESFVTSATSPTKLKRQDFLKSSIATLPNDEATKKAFQDRDEKKILQSAQSPRNARHLASTLQDELFQPLSTKKDPNRQNYKSYEEDGRLHPYSKGKKVEYPQYLERNTSAVLSPKASALTGSPRYGGMEPLNALFDGRRNIAPKPLVDNIINPPMHKDSARGGTVFSYRTFSSQIF